MISDWSANSVSSTNFKVNCHFVKIDSCKAFKIQSKVRQSFLAKDVDFLNQHFTKISIPFKTVDILSCFEVKIQTKNTQNRCASRDTASPGHQI